MKPTFGAATFLSLVLTYPVMAGQAPESGSPRQAPPQQVRPTQPAGAATEQPAARPRSPRDDEEMTADLMVARKRYSEAVPIYLKLIQREPHNAILLNKVGIAYHQMNELGQARRYYQRATKADKGFASAWNNIGATYYQEKNYKKAIKFYLKALEIRKEMPAVYSNLGYAYFARKQYDEALDAFRRAMELDPDVFERAHTGGSLVQDRTVSNHGLFYFFLAKSFAQMGNAKRCAEYLKKARDEGYAQFSAAKTDPGFSRVLSDLEVREVLGLPAPIAETPPRPPGA